MIANVNDSNDDDGGSGGDYNDENNKNNFQSQRGEGAWLLPSFHMWKGSSWDLHTMGFT